MATFRIIFHLLYKEQECLLGTVAFTLNWKEQYLKIGRNSILNETLKSLKFCHGWKNNLRQSVSASKGKSIYDHKWYYPPFKEILLVTWNSLRFIKMQKYHKYFTFQNLDIVWTRLEDKI